MFSTCLHCTTRFGRNDRFEAFPVGRRLAFDPRRGRLWVVCPACARWNLSPLEERWEGIEAMERAFRDTRLRASTDQVGMARLPDGVVLIRIGDPLRPEMAAWRYGDQLGRRRNRQLLVTGAVVGSAAAIVGGSRRWGSAWAPSPASMGTGSCGPHSSTAGSPSRSARSPSPTVGWWRCSAGMPA
jgi:hypothetical protein